MRRLFLSLLLATTFVTLTGFQAKADLMGTWGGSLVYSANPKPAVVSFNIASCSVGICIQDYTQWFLLPPSMQLSGTDLVYEGQVIGTLTADNMHLSYEFVYDSNDPNGTLTYTFDMTLQADGKAMIQDQALYADGYMDSVSGTVQKSKNLKVNASATSRRQLINSSRF